MELLEGIDGDPEAPLHVRRRRLAKRWQAELKGVAAHRGILHGPGKRLHGDRWRRKIRVPGPDVDYVHALLDQAPLDRGQLRHRIRVQGGQPFGELRHRISCLS